MIYHLKGTEKTTIIDLFSCLFSGTDRILFYLQNHHKYIFVLFILLAPNLIFSQDTTKIALSDSLTFKKPDTLLIKSDIDTMISYNAKDSNIYNIIDKSTTLFGNAKIVFKNWRIEAEYIKIDWVKNSLFATGTKDPKDSTKYIGLPNFYEGNENYKGMEVEYNFKTKSGIIKYGETSIDNSYYKGDRIKKEPENYYYIKDGTYTTCDKPHPHFYFYSPKMKVIPKEQIIAEPIVFCIADIPVFAIPFAVLPNNTGKASGIIPPAYGDDLRRGKNLRHLGYYWAMNDYSDLSFTSDWFMKGGYVLSGNFRYNLRYNFSGSLDISYSRQKFDIDDEAPRDWRIGINHNQKFDPTSQLAVNFNFMSNSYFQRTSYNYNDILRQNMVSTATYNKNWEGTNRSISINAYRDQNLTTGEINENLPSISFSQSQIYPFRFGKISTEPSWYELIGMNYNAQLQNTHKKTQDVSSLDYLNEYRRGLKQDLSFNISPKLGYLTVSPYLGYSELWYDKSIKKEMLKSSAGKDSLVTKDVKGFITTRYFNLGVSGSTRFFGIFKPKIFGITGIRHTISPSISYNLTPDFSDPVFRSYDYYTDSTGSQFKYSKFEKEIFGGPPSGKTQSVNFSFGNNFEMKTAPKDSISEENRIQLLNANASLAYNFAADSLKLSDLNLNYRTNIANIIDLSGGTNFSFYKFDSLRQGIINKYLLEDHRIARLTNINFSISATFKGEKTAKDNNKNGDKNSLENKSEENQQQKSKSFGLYDQEQNLDIPWNLSLSYDYNFNKSNPFSPYKSSTVRFNLGFNLTQNWKFSFSSYYDVIKKELLAPVITVYRDLHCWEMNFSWVPTGPYARFNFEIRIKAPQLQDIKIQKQGSTTGVFN